MTPGTISGADQHDEADDVLRDDVLVGDEDEQERADVGEQDAEQQDHPDDRSEGDAEQQELAGRPARARTAGCSPSRAPSSGSCRRTANRGRTGRRGWPWPRSVHRPLSRRCIHGAAAALRLHRRPDYHARRDRQPRPGAASGRLARPARARAAVADRPHRPDRDASPPASRRSSSTSASTPMRRWSSSSPRPRSSGLAWVVGLSTERLGSLTGPQVGGILNATFGNIAELIIAFFALQAGLIEVVKASITGSIIGNLLLVLGASVLIGGLRHGDADVQPADRRRPMPRCWSWRVIGLFVPAVFAFSTSDPAQGSLTEESVLVVDRADGRLRAVADLPVHEPEGTLGGHGEPEGHAGPAWSRARGGRRAGRRGGAAGRAVRDPGQLDRAVHRVVRPVARSSSASSSCPTIGNLAEHLVAVQLAAKDKMEFAMAVCYGSSLQVALFVGAGPGARRGVHRPADGPRVHPARGGRRRRGGRDQCAHRPRRRVELARGRPADASST